MFFSVYSSRRIFVIGLIISGVTLAFCHPHDSLRNTVRDAKDQETSSSEGESCGFSGNSDIYGVGIRVGFYGQSVAIWFANYFLMRQAKILRGVMTVFALAMLIAATVFAADAQDTFAIEAFLLLQILLWSCFFGVDANSRYSSRNFHTSWQRFAATQIILFGTFVFNAWFWWRGLDLMKQTPCGTYLMYLVKVDAYGWVRTVMKVMAVFVPCVKVYSMVIEGVRTAFELRLANYRNEFRKALATAVMQSVAINAKRESTRSSRAIPASALPYYDVTDGDLVAILSRPTSGSDDARSVSSWATTIGTSPSSPHTSDVSSTSPLASPVPASLQASVVPAKGIDSFDVRKILGEVYVADQYLQTSIASCASNNMESRKKTYLGGCITIVLPPRRQHDSGESLPSLWRCHTHILKTLLTGRFTKQAFALYTHLHLAERLNPWDGPRQVYTALTTTSDSLPEWKAVALASSLRIAAEPVHIPLYTGLYFATLDFLMQVALILQLELTIIWNHITDLSTLTTVGQLIPFILGSGGLIEVLWRKWRLLNGKMSVEKEFSDDEAGDSGEEIDADARAWVQWMKAFERGGRTDAQVHDGDESNRGSMSSEADAASA